MSSTVCVTWVVDFTILRVHTFSLHNFKVSGQCRDLVYQWESYLSLAKGLII